MAVNFDVDLITASTDDGNVAQRNANYGMTDGGLWIPEKVSDSGDKKVTQTGSYVEDFTFHSGATSPGQGNLLRIDNAETLTVEIYKSEQNSSIKVNFKTKGPKDNNYTSITGVELETTSTSTSTDLSYSSSSYNEVWRFDVVGLNEIIMEIETISSGAMSIIGRFKY